MYTQKRENVAFTTGEGTAALREIESLRDVPLIKDRFSSYFTTDAGRKWVESLDSETRSLMIDLLAVRTKIIDDFCLEDKATPVQIVNLGSGYDTRAFRLTWPNSLKIFEIDMPQVVSRKKDVISVNAFVANCDYILVPFDLSKQNLKIILEENGFVATRPTIWIMEALSGYLDVFNNQHIVDTITSMSCAGSKAIATYVGNTKQAYGSKNEISKKHIFYTDSGVDFFRKNGWTAHQQKIGIMAQVLERNFFLSTYDYWIVTATLP